MTQIKSNIPKIRFSEFEGDWENGKIEDNFQVRMCKRIFNHETSNDGEIPFYKIGTIGKQADSFISKELFKEYKSEYNYPKKGEIMLTCSGTVGRTIIFDGKDSYFQDSNIVWLDNQKSEINNNFLYYIISNYDWGKLNATTITRIYNDDLRKLKVSFPSLPEQQKIASFLSSVDEKIEKIKEKKKKLEEYKKGISQKIFSQEIRFKDKMNSEGRESPLGDENGKEFGEWEEKRLGEIGDFQTSSIDKISRDGEKEVYLVNYMNVYRHESINNSNKYKLQVVTAKDSQILSNNLKKGDILFTPSSETPDDIGHSVVIFEDLENCVYSYHLMRFRPKIQLNILYSHYFCNIPEILNQLAKLSTGSTRFTISVKSFSSIKVNLPTLKEQEKIADFLSGIDEKIENVDNEIKKMEEFKKGLLQNMFV